MVELALLHSLEAKSVPAKRRVRNELRFELADGDGHLSSKVAVFFARAGPVGITKAIKRQLDLASVPVDDSRDESGLTHTRVHSERSSRTAVNLPLAARLVCVLARRVALQCDRACPEKKKPQENKTPTRRASDASKS